MRFGVLAALAVVALVVTIAPPDRPQPASDPTPPDSRPSNPAWSQLPAANDADVHLLHKDGKIALKPVTRQSLFD